MAIYKLGHVILLVFIISNAVSQNSNVQLDLYQTTNSMNTFALNFLAKTIDLSGTDLNLALAPYTVWSLLSIIAEGADGDTLAELNRALQLPDNKDLFRKSYRNLKNVLSERSDGVLLDISNAIFTPNDQILKPKFEQVTRDLYGVDMLPMDIKNIPRAVKTINTYMAKATKNRITNFVRDTDLKNAEIFLTSAIFFKGRWSTPFNHSATRPADFFDEDNKRIGSVNMMYLLAPFPYAVINEIKAVAIELPYGSGDKMSMIVLLPFRGEKLGNVIKRLTSLYSINKVMETLENSIQEYPDANVQVFFPKFRIESDLILNSVLASMGVNTLFNSQQANLLNLSYNFLYVSRLMQRGLIEVDEDGTVAAAASGAYLEDRITPPRFNANKPFAFLIVEKKTRSIVFTGTLFNPNDV